MDMIVGNKEDLDMTQASKLELKAMIVKQQQNFANLESEY